MRLIDADKFNEEIDDTALYELYNAEEIKCWVESQRTVDAEPLRHGRWICKNTLCGIIADECNCSICGQRMLTHVNERMRYCPYCGAKMDRGLEIND